MKSEVMQILMNRDGMTEAEARHHFAEVKEMVFVALDEGRFSEIEDIVADELGLEPDYVWAFL